MLRHVHPHCVGTDHCVSQSDLSSSRSFDTTFTRLFLYFTKSNSSHILVDLISLSYLIYSRDISSYLTHHFTFITSHSLSFFPNALVYYYDITGTKRDNCLLVRWRVVLLSQLEGNLSAHQLVGQLLDLLLDGYETTWNRNRNSHLILLDL